jgi:hypothetical protein
MPDEKRKRISEQNAVIRDKFKRQKKQAEEPSKASTALLTAAVGEFSDCDDIDGPYLSRALVVVDDSRSRSEQRSLDMYDQFMTEWNSDSGSGRFDDLPRGGESDSDGCDGSSSIEGSTSDGSRDDSDRKLEIQLIQRLRGGAQQFIRGTQRDSTDRSSAIGSVTGVSNNADSTISLAQNCVDEIPPEAPLPILRDFHKGKSTSPNSKGFSTLQAGVQPEVQKPAGGTGILSHLSWLLMVITVIAAYMLGAIRNGGAVHGTMPIPALPPSAESVKAEVRNQPHQHVLMTRGSNNHQEVRFNQFDEANLVWDPGSMGVNLFKSDKYLCNIVECEPGSVGGINGGSESLN